MPDVPADPYPFPLDPVAAALLVIDMQRDFLEPGGFGASLGNDVGLLRRAITPTRRLLTAWRSRGLTVIHTREGHLPDLSDLPPSKQRRGNPGVRIGDPGPLGRLLVRGEPGHAIIDELSPAPGEPVIDKPGKGAFYGTDLNALLRGRGMTQVVLVGVTTEVCVQATVREANDRGYDCFVASDCVASYLPHLHEAALAMIVAQGGILGWVGLSAGLIGTVNASA